MRWISLSLLGISLFGLSADATAQTGKKVQEIVIHSGWGGLGTPQHIMVTIHEAPDGFQPSNEMANP
jgi:hypothetical protein